MLTVEKIGGTSMSKFGDVLRNIIIGKRTPEELYRRIFVVSAYSDVTNWLLEHKKTKEPGVYGKFKANHDYYDNLDEILKRLTDINKSFEPLGLEVDKADGFISERFKQAKNYLTSLDEVLATGYVAKQNILLAAREILSSLGEAHSAFNSVNILNNNNINATFIDLCGFNDAKYLSIDQRIQNAFKDINVNATIPVATGYTKGTEGIMREFDRGYTEVTFSKIAVATGADEAIIHKEYHLSSADPKIVGIENSIPVGSTNYNVADQLADIGMEAIHPKAAKPIEIAGINIRIKNTFEPEHPGTLISKDYVGEVSKVEIISGSNEVVAIEVHDPMMVGEVGFDKGIMDTFEKHGVSYILKATNANSITMVIWEDFASDAFVKELEQKYYKVTVKRDAAIVCTLGTNIAHPGIMGKAATALSDNNVNVEAFSQSLMQVNMQFVINRKDYDRAIKVLNNALCVH